MFEFRHGRRAGGLARRVPLRRGRPFRSTSQLALSSRGPSELVRDTVLERDGFCCVACGLGGGLQPHHRVPVGRGGSSDPEVHAVVNLVAVCPECHDGIHRHPVLARQVGLLVARGFDPGLVPVFSAVRGFVFLTGDGWFVDVVDIEPDGPAAAAVGVA